MRNVRETIRERSTVMVRICNEKRKGDNSRSGRCDG